MDTNFKCKNCGKPFNSHRWRGNNCPDTRGNSLIKFNEFKCYEPDYDKPEEKESNS